MMNKNKKTTIHYMFNIYNQLFNYLELKIIRLKRKRVS